MKGQKGRWRWLAGAVLLCALLLCDCGYRPETVSPGPDEADPVSEPAETVQAQAPVGGKSYTVTYLLEDMVLGEETVAEGALPQAVPALWGETAIIAWRTENGETVDASSASVTADTRYTAVPGPALEWSGGYMDPWDDGLFHPEDAFTRSDAAMAVYALLAEKPKGETFLGDVTTRANCYQAATTLVTAGYMELRGQNFVPDVAISMEDLSSLLSKLFAPGAVRSALEGLEEPLTRGEAAVVINTLLGLEGTQSGPYYPDVAPDREDYGAIEAAGIGGEEDWGGGEGLPSGFVNLEGYLYCFGEDGYFLCEEKYGSLYFGSDCRYTSGSGELDDYVADIVDRETNASMSRDDMLRAVYDYVRDHFLYLRRNFYEIGQTGWEVEEALTMFETGKGNCYNFTGAFWALARGVGFDAVCFSGLVGVGRDPHSWVEISFDGVPYVFDVETEMSCRLQNDYYTSLYKLTYEQGEFWSYAREPYDDESDQTPAT